MNRLRIPARPLGRVRLAFLGLAVLSAALGAVQLFTSNRVEGLDLGIGGLSLVYICFWCGHAYWTESLTWWRDILAGLALTAYALALPHPAVGLGMFYVLVQNGSLYGRRGDSARVDLLAIGVFIGALAIDAGSLAEGALNRLTFFQAPSFMITGIIMRMLHEALLSQEALTERLNEASKMEAIGRLTGGVAHDFNNLLAAIIGSLDLVRLEVTQDDELRADVDVAYETSLRAAALTRQLLAFSKRKVDRPQNLSPDETLKEMHGMLNRIAGDELTVRLDLGGGRERILIDPTQFEQIVINLVSNGREATEDHGEIHFRTRVIEQEGSNGLLSASSSTGSYLQLDVTDNGVGMDETIRSRAFEPFYTTKETGTGLGLSTVYGIIKGIGGEVSIRSSPGKGTSIRILLPTTPVTPETTEEADSERQAEVRAWPAPSESRHSPFVPRDDTSAKRPVSTS